MVVLEVQRGLGRVEIESKNTNHSKLNVATSNLFEHSKHYSY